MFRFLSIILFAIGKKGAFSCQDTEIEGALLTKYKILRIYKPSASATSPQVKASWIATISNISTRLNYLLAILLTVHI